VCQLWVSLTWLWVSPLWLSLPWALDVPAEGKPVLSSRRDWAGPGLRWACGEPGEGSQEFDTFVHTEK